MKVFLETGTSYCNNWNYYKWHFREMHFACWSHSTKGERRIGRKKNVIDIKIAMYVKDDQRESFIFKEQVWWVLSLQLLTLSKFRWHNSHQNGNWSTTWRVWRSCFFILKRKCTFKDFIDLFSFLSSVQGILMLFASDQ